MRNVTRPIRFNTEAVAAMLRAYWRLLPLAVALGVVLGLAWTLVALVIYAF